VTIRKFSQDITSIDHLVELGTMNRQMSMFLIAAIKAKLNIVFCGATGSGKTTLLNVLSHHIPEHERIITIEDTPELHLKQEHVVTLQSKSSNIEGRGEITIRDLFVNSLRMRPDRIIVGEVRGGEALDLARQDRRGVDADDGVTDLRTVGIQPSWLRSRRSTTVITSGLVPTARMRATVG
jgi:pilus assembly protein CpaF